MEIPAYVLCLITLHFYGRRIPSSIMFLTSALLLIVTIWISDNPLAMLLVVSLGKLGITGVFAVIYLHATEIFPTVLRSTGLATNSFCGRIGSMLAPVVGRKLGKVSPVATIVIFAVLSFLAGIFTLWLPETKGRRLPDTVQDAEDLAKDQKFFSSSRFDQERKIM